MQATSMQHPSGVLPGAFNINGATPIKQRSLHSYLIKSGGGKGPMKPGNRPNGLVLHPTTRHTGFRLRWQIRKIIFKIISPACAKQAFFYCRTHIKEGYHAPSIYF